MPLDRVLTYNTQPDMGCRCYRSSGCNRTNPTEVGDMSKRWPDRRQLLHWLGVCLLIAIVVPFVVYAAPEVVGADESHVVLSGSMEPTISAGDIVIVAATEPSTIEEGDVITYDRDGDQVPTTHRVIEVLEEDDAFRTQGDANDQPDAEPVHESQVRGTVTLTIPYVGHVINFGNTPIGFVLLVVIPFSLLAVSELASLYRSEATAADTGSAVSVDGSDAAVEPDDQTIAITRSDLRLSAALLAGMTMYSIWVATVIPTAWSFTVAFATGFGLLSVGVVYYVSGESPDGQQSAE